MFWINLNKEPFVSLHLSGLNIVVYPKHPGSDKYEPKCISALN